MMLLFSHYHSQKMCELREGQCVKEKAESPSTKESSQSLWNEKTVHFAASKLFMLRNHVTELVPDSYMRSYEEKIHKTESYACTYLPGAEAIRV